MMKFFSFLLLLSSCSWYPVGVDKPQFAQEDLRVFEAPHGFVSLYDRDTKLDMAQQQYSQGCHVLLNGSYFGGTRPGEYYPAGYWEIEKQMIHLSGIGRQSLPVYDDPNITHFVGLSGSDMRIFANEKFKENAGPYDLAFQAGPLVLSGSVIQDFGKSWHAHEKHERTLLGKTQSGKIYFFVSTLPRALDEVGLLILDDARFSHDPITVINLDGGPSTAFFDGKTGFRSDKKLPIVFCINK